MSVIESALKLTTLRANIFDVMASASSKVKNITDAVSTIRTELNSYRTSCTAVGTVQCVSQVDSTIPIQFPNVSGIYNSLSPLKMFEHKSQ